MRLMAELFQQLLQLRLQMGSMAAAAAAAAAQHQAMTPPRPDRTVQGCTATWLHNTMLRLSCELRFVA
jgi:hypothetical protein